MANVTTNYSRFSFSSIQYPQETFVLYKRFLHTFKDSPLIPFKKIQSLGLIIFCFPIVSTRFKVYHPCPSCPGSCRVSMNTQTINRIFVPSLNSNLYSIQWLEGMAYSSSCKGLRRLSKAFFALCAIQPELFTPPHFRIQGGEHERDGRTDEQKSSRLISDYVCPSCINVFTGQNLIISRR